MSSTIERDFDCCTTGEHRTPYQSEIIAALAERRSPSDLVFRNTYNGVVALEVHTGPRKANGALPGLRVRFEEDAVVYIAVGQISARSFHSDGTELTLCNTSAAVVKATIQALLAEVSK